MEQLGVVFAQENPKKKRTMKVQLEQQDFSKIDSSHQRKLENSNFLLNHFGFISLVLYTNA